MLGQSVQKPVGIDEQENALIAQLNIGGLYEHYKGKQYRVLGIGRHSEDLTLYVYYVALYEPGPYGKLWVRPLKMFLEEIEVDGVRVPRFKNVN